MKTITYSLIATFFLFLILICSNQEKKEKSEIIQHQEAINQPLDGAKELPVLTTNIIKELKDEAIKKVEPVSKQINKTPSKELEQLGVEIVQLIEQGTSKEELAKAYEAYGDALVIKEHYDKAIEVYKEAEKNGAKDLKRLYFKLAETYALNGEFYGSMGDYLIKAREKGFRNYRALLYGSAFAEWRKDYDFMYLYHELFGNNQKAMFKAFVAFGPKKNLTESYVMSPIELFENTAYEYRKRIGYYKDRSFIDGYFDDFIEGASDGMFSREGGDNYAYEMMLTSNKNYLAVVYSKEEKWSEYILPKEYRLITYDWKGNKISELKIAKRGSLKKCKGFVLHPDNTLEVMDYAVTWKKSAKDNIGKNEENKYLDYNDLAKVNVKEHHTYRIGAMGKIVKAEGVLLGMR